MLFKRLRKDKDGNEKLDYNAIFYASSVGIAIVAGILVGGVMGYFLDKWLDTSPYLLFIFLIFGLIAGIRNALDYLRKAGVKLSFKDDESIEVKKDDNKEEPHN